MMEDHEILSRVRNELADALKALLRAEIMDAFDFTYARDKALDAVDSLNQLLGKP